MVSQLTIELENEQKLYCPGETLQGCVQLLLSKDSALGRITVELFGYTDSRISQSNGQSESVFRARTILFASEKVIHDDHFTHKSGTLRWPFTFQIPDMIDSSIPQDKWKKQEGYVATPADADDLRHPLPPTFNLANVRYGRKWHAFTTYNIETTVIESRKLSLANLQPHHCKKSIRILPRPTSTELDLHDPRCRRGVSTTHTIKTLKLLPEANNVESSSLIQRAKSVLFPSSLPKFTCDIDVSYPTILQTYHPGAIPFVIAATPRTSCDSTTIQPNLLSFYRYPSLKIRHINLSLQAITQCRCHASMLSSDIHASVTHDSVLVDRSFDDMRLALRSVAWDQKARREENGPAAIDLGKECNIRVFPADTKAGDIASSHGGNTDTEKPPVSATSGDKQIFLVPSFQTFHVSRRYRLAWHIELECVGEKMIVKGKSAEDIILLGPPATAAVELPDDGAWMVAPDDGDHMLSSVGPQVDAPPAYSAGLGTHSTVASAVGRTEGKK